MKILHMLYSRSEQRPRIAQSLTLVVGVLLLLLGATTVAAAQSWDIYVQVDVGRKTKSYDASQSANPLTSKSVQLSDLGVKAVSTAKLPFGSLQTTVSGYPSGSDADSYSSYIDVLQVDGLDPNVLTYIEATVKVPGSIASGDQTGPGVSLNVAGNYITATFSPNGTTVSSEQGQWTKVGTDRDRTFQTKIAVQGSAQTSIPLQYVLSGSAQHVGDGFTLKLNSYFSLPSGTTWTSKSGALLTSAPNHVTYHH